MSKKCLHLNLQQLCVPRLFWTHKNTHTHALKTEIRSLKIHANCKLIYHSHLVRLRSNRLDFASKDLEIKHAVTHVIHQNLADTVLPNLPTNSEKAHPRDSRRLNKDPESSNFSQLSIFSHCLGVRVKFCPLFSHVKTMDKPGQMATAPKQTQRSAT